VATSNLRRALSAAAVAAAGTAAFLSSPAAAQTSPSVTCYPPTPGCATTTSFTTTPGSGLTLTLCEFPDLRRGQTIPATATGFDPGTGGTFSIASVEQQIGTFTVSGARVGTSPVTIPNNIELGNHTVFARGTLNGTPASVSRTVNVVARTTGGGGGGGGGGGNLARTGAIVVPTVLIGLGLVAGGAALKRSSRRKASSSV